MGFSSIRNISKKQNYGKYIKSFTLFDYIIQGKGISNDERKYFGVYKGGCIKCFNIFSFVLNDYLNISNKNKKSIPSYIKIIFKKFLNNKKIITLQPGLFENNYCAFFDLFLSSSSSNKLSLPMVKFYDICTLFKNCNIIKVNMYEADGNEDSIPVVDIYFFKLLIECELKKINKSNIKKIILFKCKLSSSTNLNELQSLIKNNKLNWHINIKHKYVDYDEISVLKN